MLQYPAFNIRGIEIFLHEKEQLSNHIRREKDFFEANILDYIREKYPEQRTIVDAGANIGNHLLYFANFFKYGSIVAFEPLPDNFSILKLNSNYPNIKLFPQALSNKKEILKMSPNRINMGASKVNWDGTGTLEVEAVTIDSLNLTDVSLLKIDVEDSEARVIEGARETINRCHPLILLEDKNGLYGKMLSGYTLEKAWPNQYTYLYRYNSKPYLLSIYSYTPGCANYERTLPMLADSAERIDCRLQRYPGHLYRWDLIPKNLDRNRVFIFTDSSDVIFQKPFPELPPDKIYVANEGETFGQNVIWRRLIRKYPQFSNTTNVTNYNVGSFACRGEIMDKFVKFLQENRNNSRRMSLEQLWFNVWLRTPEIWPMVTEIPDLFCPVYANIKHGLATVKDNKLVNKDGNIFTVVHFNGSMKKIYRNILENSAPQPEIGKT